MLDLLSYFDAFFDLQLEQMILLFSVIKNGYKIGENNNEKQLEIHRTKLLQISMCPQQERAANIMSYQNDFRATL